VQVSLGLYVGYDRTQDISLVALLSEDNYAHVSQFGVAGGVEAEVKCSCVEIFQGADALQAADDARMLKAPATVFAVANVGGICWINQSRIELRV
jgi:hypothetical protein